ncbi:MAG TPA: zinc ribbon domain-containing protein [Pyrinomonadaceae bacterium]
MFCPQCGANQSEELKFCNLCGANLQAVRQVVALRETSEDKFDWSKTWVAEMFLSEAERKRRLHTQKAIEHELESQRGITPEVRRYNEIKAGIITSSIGLGSAIFLFILMQGIIQGGQTPPHANEILSRVWIAGVVPFLVGIALIINGLFVSKKIVEVTRRESSRMADALGGDTARRSLNSADTSEISPASFSVTEETTKHLVNSRPKQ